MEKELRKCFNNVRDSVNAALAHHQIWFTLRGDGNAIDEYLDDMNDVRYADFFHAVSVAHYKLMFIEIGCIFDSDNRTDRFRKLKELLVSNGLPGLSKKFNDNLVSYGTLVSNILTVRSRLIAHKETGIERSKIYQKHGIKPDEIKALLNILAVLMEELEKHLNDNSSCTSTGPTDRWEKATYGLLKVLRRGRNS